MKREMTKFNKYLFLLLSIVSVNFINAQREPQYTQYINNTLTYNPAYISTQEDVTFTALGRSQWMGFDGAPNTYSFSAILPTLSNSFGTGLNIIHDEIGPTKQTSISANFSYEIMLSPTIYTSFGVSAGGSFLSIDYGKGNYLDPNDPLLNNRNDFDPSFGFGVMTYSENWYVGLSIPNFLKSKYYSGEGSKLIDSENLQYFILGGYIFNISENLKLKPAVLAKIQKNLPYVVDYSANALINNKITVGVSYRSSDIVTGLFGIQLTDQFYLGYSYDHTLNGLTGYNDGSHEIMLKFTLPKKIRTIQSPRFY
ncbi:type IX secretion system membrane protein PorP/SprF [Polaribacter sp. MSW13]|uniref:Type IX secretion system membrane protein PorP/SprF n=1 Tax=Polaribacter marinus TaxID=2916838 RepID=A0A9X2AMJ5_9FLAO|nr:type IX secretion system membrane protein PorP/SprF [Polaribacter marinus]MCI2229004.1 type IX secretion system membrane protein PorP/SprF [Polaribacter marinus]